MNDATVVAGAASHGNAGHGKTDVGASGPATDGHGTSGHGAGAGGSGGDGFNGDGVGSGSGSNGAAGGVAGLVTLLTDRALAVAAQASRAPSSVRITAGEVHVEICWPTSPPAVLPAQESQSLVVQAAGTVRNDGFDRGPAAASDADPGVFPLCAGTVGTFYRAPEPGAAPFVTEGDQVRTGQQVGIIEAMKLMIPVEAERPGRVVEFLVADRAPVEYGQPLMLVREPSGEAGQ